MSPADPPDLEPPNPYYEEMFRRNPAPKLLIEAESGRIADANPAALDFYGYSLAQIRALTIQDINTLSASEVKAERDKARREERRYFAFRHRLANGEVRDVKVYTGPITLDGREYLHSIVHDVTEVYHYQEHLEEYKDIFETLLVGVFRNTPGDEGEFREVNPALARILGADSAERLLATPVARIYQTPQERQRVSEKLLREGELHGHEIALRTLDGRPIWAALTAHLRETAEGETIFEGALEDITNRKATETALAHERQVAEALRRILSELVYQTPPPATLFERVCSLAVETGGFRLAWLGRLDAEGWLRPEAWSGEATDYLEGLALSRHAEHAEGQGPGGQALRKGEPVVVQDLYQAPGMEAWRQRAENSGLWGAAVLPFREGGEVRGALVVYAPSTHFFSDAMVDLLGQMSHAVGYALESHTRYRERQQAERDLRASEERYRSILTAMSEGVALHGADGAIVAINPAAERILGLSEGQILGRDSLDPRWRAIAEDGSDFPGEQHPAMVSLRTGEEVRGQIMGIEDPERGTRWISINAEPLLTESGVTGTVATFTDITEQREAERSRDQLVQILEATPDFVSIAKPDGTVLYVNQGGRRLIGLPPAPASSGSDIPADIQEHEAAGQWGHPDWAARIVGEEGIPTAMEKGYWEGETALIDVEGREIPTSQVILAHRDEHGEVTRLSTILRDISQQKALQRRLEERQHALERERNLFAGGPTVVFQWRPDAARTITYVSPNVTVNFGYDAQALLGRPFSKLVRPDDRGRLLAESRNQAEAGNDSYDQEYRLITGDGRVRWVHDFTVANRDDSGAVESYQGYLLDITERRELEAEQRLLATAFHTSQALLITDATGTIERVNPAFTTITGYTAEEAVGANPRMLASGQHDADFYAAMWRQLKEQDHWEGEIWNRRKSGDIYPEWQSITAVRDEQGQVANYVAVFHEISEQKHLEAELERLATHDRLTGIYNRTKLYELLEAAREENERYGTPFSVIMFDIDHFKAVNDTYGHSAGDTVLRELTGRVQGVLRETDYLGRWGGEEFLILAGHADRAGGEQLAERVRQVVAEEPFPTVGAVTVSLGVAEAQVGEGGEQLEERADEALYAAKEAGRNQVVVDGEGASSG